MKNKAFRLIASSLTLRKIAKPKRNINTTGCQVDWRHNIIEQTEVSTNHLTPEIPLHLITRNCPLWHQKEDESIFKDPFWAFYWPGGQALTRFILDHPEVVRGRSVLDVGSGCGASAIAAVKSGASQVTANDIDLVAIEAIRLNCELNSVTIATSLDNLIGSQSRGNWEVVFLGDMFYDEEFTDRVHEWTRSLSGSSIFIGDPGRLFLENHPLKEELKLVHHVELPDSSKEENYGFTNGYVWEIVNR